MTSIKSKLEGTGIEKIIFTFLIDSNKYNLTVQNSEGTGTAIDISENEINTVKAIFLNRVIRAWNKKYNDPPKAVIIRIDIEIETFEIFIENMKNNIYKFDY